MSTSPTPPARVAAMVEAATVPQSVLDQVAVLRRGKGANVREIAKAIGVRRELVSAALWQLGMHLHQLAAKDRPTIAEAAERVAAGESRLKVGAEIGMSTTTFRQALRMFEEAKRPSTTSRAATIRCLGRDCGRMFPSWDRAANRLCPRCSGSSADSTFRIAAPRRH